MSTERPKHYTPEMYDTAAAKVARSIVDAYGDRYGEEDDLAACIRKVIPGNHRDGYQMARALDDEFACLIDPDRDLVEELDNASHELYTALKAAVRAWVAEQGIKPKLAQGDKVMVTLEGTTWDGIIGKVDPKVAEYVVSRPAKGDSIGSGRCCPASRWKPRTRRRGRDSARHPTSHHAARLFEGPVVHRLFGQAVSPPQPAARRGGHRRHRPRPGQPVPLRRAL